MEKNFGKTISMLYRKSHAYMGTALLKYNLTAAEQPFFSALQKHDGTTQEELSSLLNIDKSATARTIKSLEEKGYVIRITDQNDRRQNRVFLTEKARDCRACVANELNLWNEILTKGIDEHTLTIAYTAMSIMEKNIKEKLNL